MTDLEQATIYAGEVRVAAWNENKDGIFVRLELETSDVHPFKHEQGQRFIMVCTRIGNDEQPDPNKPAKFDHKAAYQSKTEGEKAVTRAVLLCKDTRFRAWALGAVDYEPDENDIRNWLLALCGISSRAELVSNPQGLERFLEIEHDWREATGQAAECRS